MNEVFEAEKAIAKILAELEIKTGSLVEGLTLRSVEVTKINDERPQHVMHVEIRLQRQPGRSWY